jgi:hypothetical protein
VLHTVFGTADGIRSPRNRGWGLGDTGVGLTAVDNDRFGGALVTGDFDSDGADDLVIGSPGAELLGEPGAGLVVVLYGQPGGLFWDGFESGSVAAWSASSTP